MQAARTEPASSSSTRPRPGPLDALAVIGNGIMGHGIAQVFAMAGKRVVMIGRSESSLAGAMARIRASLDDFIAHDLISATAAEAALDRIVTSTSLSDARASQLVIEVVTEDVGLKRRIFAQLDGICGPDVVLASSSGQPASALNQEVARKDRVIAAHFWYPPQLIPLVEVCGGPHCDPNVVTWTCGVIREAGKQPVVIERELPGFIGNRLQFALLREAWSLWASGAASAEAIDAVVRHTIGRRLGITGPLESADLGGIETMYQFARSLLPELDRSAEPPAAIAELLRQTPAGTARRGVHDWSRRDDQALLRMRNGELFRWVSRDRRQQTRA
jgi:3-hydroxybutyryl-CoA dehydrogenase